MAADKFENMPLGGWQGEMTVVRSEPAPPAPEPFVIPPPPWVRPDGSLDPDALAELEAAPAPEPELTPLERMKVEAGETYEPEPFRPIVPPGQPLVPFVPPKVDWRAEERARLAREQEEAKRHARARRAQLLQELLEEDQEQYPR